MVYALDPLLAAIADRDEIVDEQLDVLRIAILTEQERRRLLDTAPEQVAAVNAAYVAAIGRHDGDAWAQPLGAHDAYRTGAVVTHNGKTWESTTPNNVWEPGISGWREQAPDDPETGEPGVPDFVQPTGGHDAYKIGDRVRFDGKIYESVIGDNAWSPSAHAAGWTLIP